MKKEKISGPLSGDFLTHTVHTGWAKNGTVSASLHYFKLVGDILVDHPPRSLLLRGIHRRNPFRRIPFRRNPFRRILEKYIVWVKCSCFVEKIILRIFNFIFSPNLSYCNSELPYIAELGFTYFNFKRGKTREQLHTMYISRIRRNGFRRNGIRRNRFRRIGKTPRNRRPWFPCRCASTNLQQTVVEAEMRVLVVTQCGV